MREGVKNGMKQHSQDCDCDVDGQPCSTTNAASVSYVGDENAYGSQMGGDGMNMCEMLKKTRRMASNRESARRSRERKVAMVEEMNEICRSMQLENADILRKIHLVTRLSLAVHQENMYLRALAQQAKHRKSVQQEKANGNAVVSLVER